MRDLPQLKVVREEQGWSQRTLAARSGVAQNTISQLERGERKAMPSTVRKLADALGVGPPILMAQASQEMEEREGRSGSVESSRRREDLRNRGSQPSRLPRIAVSAVLELDGKRIEEDALVRKEWYETGRWAEYYVSGELVKRAKAFAETPDIASILSDAFEGYLPEFLSNPEQQYLENIKTALHSYIGDLVAVRSRLFANDPNETVLAAQLVLGRAKKIVEEHESYLLSFRRIPERYYADTAAHSRILKLEEALSKQREAAAEDVQKLMDLYEESLDTLEEQIIAMRKESKVLEKFVMQAHDWESERES